MSRTLENSNNLACTWIPREDMILAFQEIPSDQESPRNACSKAIILSSLLVRQILLRWCPASVSMTRHRWSRSRGNQKRKHRLLRRDWKGVIASGTYVAKVAESTRCFVVDHGSSETGAKFPACIRWTVADVAICAFTQLVQEGWVGFDSKLACGGYQ